MGHVKRIWYLSPMRAAKVQASLRIRAVSPEPPLLAHTRSEARGTCRQKARSVAPLNGWACAVKICHDGMLEDTNSLDAAQLISFHFIMDKALTLILNHFEENIHCDHSASAHWNIKTTAAAIDKLLVVYGMRNVALFDIFIFLLDLTSLLLYSFWFIFNVWPFLFYMFRFYSIFYDLYSISVYFYCIIFVYIVYSVICIVYFWICI